MLMRVVSCYFDIQCAVEYASIYCGGGLNSRGHVYVVVEGLNRCYETFQTSLPKQSNII